MSYIIKGSPTPSYGFVVMDNYIVDLKALLVNELVDEVGMTPENAEEFVASTLSGRTGYIIQRLQLFKPLIERFLRALSRSSIEELRAGGLIKSFDEVKFLPPVRDPTKIIGIGLNYEDYRVMLGYPKTEVPLFFFKPLNTLIGHRDYIVIPKGGRWSGTKPKILFHEYEFAVVIGRRMKDVSRNEVYDYVFGFTLFGDITAHDIEMVQPGHVLYQQRSKAFDTFSPLGPWVVSMDEIRERGIDVNNLRILRRRNGVVEGESNTSRMIFKPDEVLEFLSEIMTLEPGDVVSLGSPPAGPPEGLQPGDVIEEEVEEIGVLVNYVK